MIPDAFSLSEQIWAIAATFGAVIAAIATAEAIGDYRRSFRRTRVVACKNAVGQAGLLLAQGLLSVVGWFAVTQPPTPVQINPVLQTYVFYAAIPSVAIILLVTSVWTRLLYWRLFDTAEGDGWH